MAQNHVTRGYGAISDDSTSSSTATIGGHESAGSMAVVGSSARRHGCLVRGHHLHHRRLVGSTGGYISADVWFVQQASTQPKPCVASRRGACATRLCLVGRRHLRWVEKLLHRHCRRRRRDHHHPPPTPPPPPPHSRKATTFRTRRGAKVSSSRTALTPSTISTPNKRVIRATPHSHAQCPPWSGHGTTTTSGSTTATGAS